MKILIVGPWRWPQYEEAFAQGLQANGAQADGLRAASFFDGTFARYELALPIPGPSLMRLNRAVISRCAKTQPDWLLFWRPTHILPRTVQKVRAMGCLTASYNNDDPFGPEVHGNVPWHHHWLWHWYHKCLPWFDRNFFYRRVNCEEALESGARHADVLMPYFVPWMDRPVRLTKAERERFETDVAFVGHYEPDGREESIRMLMDAGIRIRLWGGRSWNRTELVAREQRFAPIIPAEGDEYAKALGGAKIGLCFLSKLNRDTYTRRYFEIPACRRVILGERSEDLEWLFKEDREACFFSSNKELVEKARWLLANPKPRERIARAGMRRIWADGHDVITRARNFLSALG